MKQTGATKNLNQKRPALRPALLAGTALLIAWQPAAAQEWQGGIDNQWVTPGNWDGGVAPTDSDNVVVDETPGPIVDAGDTAEADSLIVGSTSEGGLNVVNGGELLVTNQIRIGDGSGAEGRVTVDGAGSLMDVSAGTLTVGASGHGELQILNGADVTTSHATRLGLNQDSTAAVWVEGTGSLLDIGQDLIVGQNGSAELIIRDGASVAGADDIYLGRYDGSVGLVLVQGADSVLSIGDAAGDAFHVGFGGYGDLTVNQGGEVLTSGDATIGSSIGEGHVTVDGDDSLFTVGRDLYVGEGGSGELDISDGGVVVATSGTSIGSNVNSTGRVLVDGAGSLLDIGTYLSVGNLGDGDLTISNGGEVISRDTTSIGTNASGTGQVTVSGAGSLLSVDSALLIGGLGQGGVNIVDGGEVRAFGTRIGSSADGEGMMTVQGPDSLLNVRATLSVGDEGSGELHVLDGGEVSVSFAGSIGSSAGSQGLITVSGADSVLDVGTDLTIGLLGDGALTIANDALVRTGDPTVLLADAADSSGTLNIGAAAGQAAQGAGVLEADVLDFGDGEATLVFNHTGTEAGAYTFTADLESYGVGDHAVDHRAGFTIYDGDGSGFTGTTTVRGGTLQVINRLGASSIHVGSSGSGELHILAGAQIVSSGWASVGEGGGDGLLIVDGTGALFDVATRLYVGNNGDGELRVLAGGETAADEVRIGESAGAEGLVILDGADSLLTVGSDLSVGYRGAGRMNILGGGEVVTGDVAFIGNFSGSEGLMTIEGVGSLLDAGSALYVGANGDGELNILDGGEAVSTFSTYIGSAADGQGLVNVQGEGSLLDVGANLFLGSQGNGELNILNGGEVLVAMDARIGGSADGAGLLTVDGAGSLLDVGASLSVGDAAVGELNILDGGEVTVSTFTQIGQSADGEGRVTVGGAGSLLESGLSIYVGNTGRGALNIVDGGEVVTSSTTFIGRNFGATGLVTVDGANSLLEAETVNIGAQGDGALTVSNDAVVRTGNPIILADIADSSATLNIGAAEGDAAQGAGVLEADLLDFGGGDAALVFNHTATEADGYTFTADLESSGDGNHALDHLAGFTIYDGDGSAFSGTTTVRGGTLQIDSVLGGAIEVLGGALGGTGEVGAVTIGAGGAIAPGASIGTFNVGDITFLADSFYNVEIMGNGDSDLIAASGTATLDGGTVNVIALDPSTSYQDAQDYTILTATGGVLGSGFDEAVTSSAFITPTLAHGANDVTLTITLNTDPDPDPDPGPDPDPDPDPDPTDPDPEPPVLFVTVAQTDNQIEAATALDGLDQTSGSDALAVYNRILMLSADEARQAFNMASGEVHASGQHLAHQTFGLFNRTLRRQAASGLGSPGASAVMTADMDQTGAQAWMAPLAGRGTLDEDGNAAPLDWWTVGLSGGYEGPLDVASGAAWAGFGLGYQHSRGAVDDRWSLRYADDFQAGVYGGWADGPWTLSGALAYGASQVETERRIVFRGVDRTARADYWTHSVGFSGEAAYGVDMGGGTVVSPLFTLNAEWAGHDGFSETGADSLDLSGGSENWTQVDTGLGIGVTHVQLTDSGVVTFHGRGVWEHAFGDVLPSQSLGLAGSPVGFRVDGPGLGRDRLRVGGGFHWRVSPNTALRADYDGAFFGDQSAHSGSISFSLRF